MNKLLFAVLTAISINSFGQQWTEYHIDSVMSITIPDNFETFDTLGQRIITAQVDNGLIIISVLENKGKMAINAKNEKDLIDSYKGFQKGSINSQKGELITSEIVEINGLKFLKFSFRATMEEEEQIRHCIAAFINERTYSVFFWELESMTEEMTPVREKLYSSITVPPTLTMRNQMSDSNDGSQAYNIGFFFGQTIATVFIFAIVVYLIILVSKKLRKKSTNAKQKL